MTQEEKELLLKDLCARLPYGLKVEIKLPNHKNKTFDSQVGTLKEISLSGGYLVNSKGIEYRSLYLDIKPYLRPMSSMTEEEKKEFDQLIELELKAINDEIDPTQATAFEVDFYNKHHFDWRGLIPLGLAIDATGLNIY